MKKLLLIPILALLIGCGGGDSYSYEKDLKPTAKITKKDAEFLAPLVFETARRFPRSILESRYRVVSSSSVQEQEQEQEEVVRLPNVGTSECSDSGNIEIAYLKGSSSDKYNNSGSVEYNEIYNNCHEEDYTQDGTMKNEIAWSEENNITTIDERYLQIGKFSYIKDANNSFIRDSFEGIAHDIEYEDNATSNYVTNYEGELKYQSKKYNFRKFKRVQNMEYPFAYNPDRINNKIELSGVIDSKVFHGTVIIKTIKKLKFKRNCIYGKIEIKASNHTVSIVCSEDSVNYYFDEELLN